MAALYVKEGTPFVPMFYGGGQEGGRRAGTENVLLIAAIGKAAQVRTLVVAGREMNCGELI